MPAIPTIVYFDLETSGRQVGVHEIIQIAAVAARHGAIVAEFEVKLQFNLAHAEREALEINSYDADAWRSALPARDGLERFGQFLRQHGAVQKIAKASRKPYTVAKLAGHNAVAFDMPFLAHAFKAHDLYLPADWLPLDTLLLADWLRAVGLLDSESLTLGELCKLYAIPLDGAHDALADVRATAALGLALQRHLSAARVG